MADSQVSLEQQEQVLENNRDFIVKRLDADDVIDELIQTRLIGQNAAQRVGLIGTSRVEKNRIIFDQLITCGPGALEKFCEILRRKKRQTFIAEQLEKCIHSTTTSEPATTVKCSSLDVNRLKARYNRLLPTGKTDWPKHKVTQYVRLAIVEKEDVTLRDEHLNELTRLTLQGDIDKILKKKQPLGDLRDIFHYNDEPCPRVILIMGGPGIGKTTLANELCVRWARDGYLAEDFDAVMLIPLRSVQQRSLEDIITKHIGEENYQQMKKLAGSRCLIILEGLDELAINCRQNDPFLLCLKECTVLEEATILITSRPHACEDIDAGRRIEVVGFGNDEIREFVEKSFPQDTQSVQEFLWQLYEYPQLHSLCYIPNSLVMIVDIFRCSEKKLPSTLTELYQVFIVMILKRQVKKENVTKKPAVCSSVAIRAGDSVEETLCVMLRGIPRETVGIVFCLSRLAYRGFYDWYCHREDEYGWEKKWKEPKIIFTESDLIQCDIEVTSDFDGFGLLKATQTHQLLTDINTYSFNHLTIQEYLCAVYISLQSQEEQLSLLREHFDEYPNIFTYVCGLTELASSEMFQFIYSKLTSPGGPWRGDPNVITAMRCINESKQSSGPHQSFSPFALNVTWNTLLPYDCLCLSNVLSCYPVSQLKMGGCHIGNEGAELLVKHYPNKNITSQLLEEVYLRDNDLTSEGMEHVMKIVRTSSTTLRVLNVNGNDIGDDWMALISKALQHNKSLTTLRVTECELTVKGAISISKMMMVNHSLQELYMSDNNIGDDGISAIAGALGNCKINVLNVQQCGITLTGARSLAKALSFNHTIRALGLGGNPITVEGALLIVKSAVDSTVCQRVGIDYEYQNDEIKKMMNILEDRRKEDDSSSSETYSVSEGDSSEDIPLKELLPQFQIAKNIIENNSNSSSEELVPIIAGDEPTVNMEMSLMNRSAREDDHFGGQEETRICYHSDQVPSKKDHHLLS